MTSGIRTMSTRVSKILMEGKVIGFLGVFAGVIPGIWTLPNKRKSSDYSWSVAGFYGVPHFL